MVVHPDNLGAGGIFGRCHEFKVCTGALYLGGYTRDDTSKGGWLKTGSEIWERDIRDFRKTAEKYPRESYTAAARAVQSEWIVLKHMMKDMGQALKGLEKVLQETFLPYLFLGILKALLPVVGALSTLPVKKSRLGLHSPVTSEN